jgi:glycosyltransferase involved in cell wall biosynthesis
MAAHALKLGYACHWQPEPRATWSGTPFHLRRALAERAALIDLDLSLSTPLRTLARLAYVRRSNGTFLSTWRSARPTQLLIERQLKKLVERRPCDAVLEIGDLAVVGPPFFLYQDLSLDILLEQFDPKRGRAPHFPGLSLRAIERARERQLLIYSQADGVFAMSKWFAHTLTERSGVDKAKVHVIHPGTNSTPGIFDRPLPLPERQPPRTRLLFVGKDFFTKGGDLVVAAFARLRNELGPSLTLTVVGPKEWPLPEAIPVGVSFLGRLPPIAVVDLFMSHDMLVVPSRFEGFGIVFAEALACGMPCIGRDAFAMPEIIRHGVNGALLRGEDPEDLASLISEVASSDTIYESCHKEAVRVRAYYNWGRAAEEMLAVMRG